MEPILRHADLIGRNLVRVPDCTLFAIMVGDAQNLFTLVLDYLPVGHMAVFPQRVLCVIIPSLDFLKFFVIVIWLTK